MLHMDRVRSKRYSETEPKPCWNGEVLDQNLASVSMYIPVLTVFKMFSYEWLKVNIIRVTNHHHNRQHHHL